MPRIILRPDAAGDLTGLTKVPGSRDNFDCLNDYPRDLGVDSYVYTSDAGLFTFVQTVDAITAKSSCGLDPDYLVLFIGKNGIQLNCDSYSYSADLATIVLSDQIDFGAAETIIDIGFDYTKTPRLGFAAGSTLHRLYSFTYLANGNTTLVSTINPGVNSPNSVALDTTRNFAFFGFAVNVGVGIHSYPYANDGTIGAMLDATAADALLYRGLDIDTSDTILFAAVQQAAGPGGLFSFTYDGTTGVMTPADQANAFQHWAHGVAVDPNTGYKLAFGASTSGLHVYRYDSSGTFSAALSSDVTITGYSVSINTVKKRVYLDAGADGVRSYSYDINGIITFLSSDDQGGTYRDNALDTVNSAIFSCTSLNGVHGCLLPPSVGLDAYALPNIAGAPQISVSRVAISMKCKSETSDTCQVRGGIRLGTDNVYGALQNVGAAWFRYYAEWYHNPIDATEWQQGNVNNLQMLVELTPNGNTNCLCTQAVILVDFVILGEQISNVGRHDVISTGQLYSITAVDPMGRNLLGSTTAEIHYTDPDSVTGTLTGEVIDMSKILAVMPVLTNTKIGKWWFKMYVVLPSGEIIEGIPFFTWIYDSVPPLSPVPK